MTCPAISLLFTRKWVRVLQLWQELSASVRQVASIIQQAAITGYCRVQSSPTIRVFTYDGIAQ